MTARAELGLNEKKKDVRPLDSARDEAARVAFAPDIGATQAKPAPQPGAAQRSASARGVTDRGADGRARPRTRRRTRMAARQPRRYAAARTAAPQRDTDRRHLPRARRGD